MAHTHRIERAFVIIALMGKPANGGGCYDASPLLNQLTQAKPEGGVPVSFSRSLCAACGIPRPGPCAACTAGPVESPRPQQGRPPVSGGFGPPCPGFAQVRAGLVKAQGHCSPPWAGSQINLSAMRQWPAAGRILFECRPHSHRPSLVGLFCCLVN